MAAGPLVATWIILQSCGTWPTTVVAKARNVKTPPHYPTAIGVEVESISRTGRDRTLSVDFRVEKWKNLENGRGQKDSFTTLRDLNPIGSRWDGS